MGLPVVAAARLRTPSRMAFVSSIGLRCGMQSQVSVGGAVCMKAGGKKGGKKSGKKSTAKVTPVKRTTPIDVVVSAGDATNVLEPSADRMGALGQDGAVVSEVPMPSAPEVPMDTPQGLSFPEAPSSLDGVKRRRRPRKSAEKLEKASVGSGAKTQDVSGGGEGRLMPGDALSVDTVRKLTEDFRKGSSEGNALLSEIEKEPDFLLQSANPSGKYDLTSAMLGIGKANKQGVYLLPYLQSGHILLLLVISLCAFVYYPGFPLTELDVGVTDALKKGLALTFTVNLGVAYFSYKEALKRDQPAAFWALKASLLGGLALTELRNNTVLKGDSSK